MRHLLTPLLMASCFFVVQAHQMILVFKESAGIWHPDRWKPLVSACLNLGLNILFVISFPEGYKLDGVILSTVLALTFIDTPWELYVVFTLLFNAAQARHYLKLQLKLLLIAVVLSAVTWCGAAAMPFEGLAGLLIKACISAIISGGMTLVLFRSDFNALIKWFLDKRREAPAS